jgi:hypothetical protein
VSVATSEPEGADADAAHAGRGGRTAGDALSVEPGKSVVTATVNGTVQMK